MAKSDLFDGEREGSPVDRPTLKPHRGTSTNRRVHSQPGLALALLPRAEDDVAGSERCTADEPGSKNPRESRSRTRVRIDMVGNDTSESVSERGVAVFFT